MSCCKADKRVNPYTKSGDKVERGKYKMLKWVLFGGLCIISPIFLIPMLYMLYVTIVREERLDLTFMLESVGKIIKTYKLMKTKPDVNLDEFEVYEVK
jgi:uncharacterized membrane protein YukC